MLGKNVNNDKGNAALAALQGFWASAIGRL